MLYMQDFSCKFIWNDNFSTIYPACILFVVKVGDTKNCHAKNIAIF